MGTAPDGTIEGTGMTLRQLMQQATWPDWFLAAYMLLVLLGWVAVDVWILVEVFW